MGIENKLYKADDSREVVIYSTLLSGTHRFIRSIKVFTPHSINDLKKMSVRNKISGIDEATKTMYVEELDDIYFHMQRKASDFWDENRLECPHCTENQDLEEENIALELEASYMHYHQKDLREDSNNYLERVFTDADVVFDLFSKHNDYDGGKIIGWKLLTDDLLPLQIHHAAFVVSKRDLTNTQKELISSLMYSCVVEAKKIIEANFPTLKEIFKI